MQSGSVDRGAGRGATTKMQNKENTTFFALPRLSLALEWIKKWAKAFLKHILGRLICQKQNSKISKNFENGQK